MGYIWDIYGIYMGYIYIYIYISLNSTILGIEILCQTAPDHVEL